MGADVVTINRINMLAGVHTLFQAGGQMVLTILGLFQYFCIIDFLVELPLLIFIRILYFHNPATCGNRINIGQSLDGMANQAFVLLTREPVTVTRTFIINSIGFGLSVLWVATSIVLMRGGAMGKQSKPLRWPWIIVSTAVCGLDLVATVTYANDTFHTRTLTDMMDFIGGDVSGTGNSEIDTSWTAWVMVLIYSRLIILFLFNLIIIVLVIIHGSEKRLVESTAVQVEAPTMEVNSSSDRDENELNARSENPFTNILPRPGLRQSFRLMKARLFREPSPVVQRPANMYSIDESTEMSDFPYMGNDNADYTIKNAPVKSSRVHQVDEIDHKKRVVYFPENLLSLPQRLECMIAEQQRQSLSMRRLDKALVDPAGHRSPPRAPQSLPQVASTSVTADVPLGVRIGLNSFHREVRSVYSVLWALALSQQYKYNLEETKPPCNRFSRKDSSVSVQGSGYGYRRRGTAAKLQGQLPWAYIPASGHLKRDQLPGEDLPPVPLPDYNAIPSFRKASVHRAASSLSSITQKLDKSQLSRQPTNQLDDVLY